jgi:outer membrane protein assembly factor BamB
VSNDGPWHPPFDRPSSDPPPFDRPPPDGPPPDPRWVDRPAPDPRRVDRPAIERQRFDRQRLSSDEAIDERGPGRAYGRAPDRAYGGGPDRAYGRGARSAAPAEAVPDERRRAHRREPEPEPDGDGGPRRSRALVAVASLAALGVVAALLVRQTSGGESGRGAGDQGWEAEQYGNSQMLAGDDERVCSVSADRLLFCLDPATGEEQFSHQFYDSIVTSPALAGGRVLVASSRSGSTGALVAFSTDGTEQWAVPVDISTDRRMPVVGDVVAIVSGDAPAGELVAIDVATGAERWRMFTSADDGTQPHVVSTNAFADGSRFYVAVAYEDPSSAAGVSGQIVAVDPGSGEELWRSPVLPTITWSRGITAVAPFTDGASTAFLLDAGMVGEDGQPLDQREVVVLDTESGELRWNVPVAGIHAGLAHLDDLTVVVDGAEMHAYDAGGQVVWTAPTPTGDDAPDGPEPVRLVAEDGHLFAVGRDVFEIDAATGGSALVIDSGTTRDVVAAGDHVVVAGVFAVAAVPLSDLSIGERQVTVVTG